MTTTTTKITTWLESLNFTPHFNGTTKGGTTNWKCRINRFQFPYFQGSAHTKEPVIKDLMYCLVVDSTVEAMDYDEFCNEFGYNDLYDSFTGRKNKEHNAVFKACKVNTDKLLELLPANIGLDELREYFQDY